MYISNFDVLPSLGLYLFAFSLAIYESAYFYTFHFFGQSVKGGILV